MGPELVWAFGKRYIACPRLHSNRADRPSSSLADILTTLFRFLKFWKAVYIPKCIHNVKSLTEENAPGMRCAFHSDPKCTEHTVRVLFFFENVIRNIFHSKKHKDWRIHIRMQSVGHVICLSREVSVWWTVRGEKRPALLCDVNKKLT